MTKKIHQPATLNYSDIEIGAVYEFSKRITEAEVDAFAHLTGDFNPLHCDPSYGEKTQFHRNIVHGMLVGSLFSTLVGMHCPGKKCLYLSQTLRFKKPIFMGDEVLVRGTVTDKSDSVKVITIKTEVLVDQVVTVSGEAKVTLLEAV